MMSFTFLSLLAGKAARSFSQPGPSWQSAQALPAGTQDFLASRSPTWARINAEPESSFARNAR